ncbi:hypothetical protein ACWD6Z_23250, partial [Streptomyces californicus]
AWLLARVPFPGKAFVRSLVLLPMVLPPTVGGRLRPGRACGRRSGRGGGHGRVIRNTSSASSSCSVVRSPRST